MQHVIGKFHTMVNGGYVDVYLRETSAFGQYHWVNRVDTFQNGGNTYTQGTPQNGNTYHHASGIIQVLATNIQVGYDRVRIVNRTGEFLVNALHFLTGNVAQPPTVYTHSDNVVGDPGSLSDTRLKTNQNLVSPEQALNVLGKIEAYTYGREDLKQRRLGLIADQVQDTIQELGIDNVVSSKWHSDDIYKTLDYSRLVSLLIPAINELHRQIKALNSKYGTIS